MEGDVEGMDGTAYRYLFPFEKVPANSRILIYGAGFLGQEYLKQIRITGYCEVLGFIDKNYAAYPSAVVPVYAPDNVCSHVPSFDYIVIALRAAFALPDVLRTLLHQGVDRQKIVYVLERPCSSNNFFIENESLITDTCLSCDNNSLSIALYLGGGIGDMVNQKRFVIELISLVPSMAIDIYAVKHVSFLKWLYSDCPQIKQVVPDLGIRYQQFREKYALAMSIIATFFLEVDKFNCDFFWPEFSERIVRLQKRCEEEELSIPLPNGIAYRRRMYNGENCYTWFNFGDIFSINDFHVKIPFQQRYLTEYQSLGLGKYITVNIGNGASGDTSLVAKSWPRERFQAVLSMFRKRYTDIEIVQVGAGTDFAMREADFHMLGCDFGLLVYVLRGAVLHLDIEGGLVHMASQIGTRCFVLFGPTPVDYFGYSDNINIKAGGCHDCYGLYSNTNCCARHMEKPECMYSITPNMVMEEIDEYMSIMGISGRKEDIYV